MKFHKNAKVGLGMIAAGVLLAACGGGSSDSGDNGGGETTGSTDSGLTIGVSFYSMQVPLFVEMLQGIEDVAAEQGIEIIFYDAGGSAEQQINQIENLITSEVDAIIASPADATALVPVYESVRAAGIPIFSAANKVADEYEDGFVGPNLSALANETMDLLIDCMDGSGEMVLITGPPVIAFVQLQQAGWDQALAANPDVSVVQTLVD
jgi:ABC-type sugar transport system substrate-binding protein